MNRRKFLELGVAGGVAALTLPTLARAGSNHARKTLIPAGGIYYTAATPGRWSSKAKPHLPIIEKSGQEIQVVTPHAMKAHAHYITKHVLLDEHFTFIAERVFDPVKDMQALSKFELKGYSGTLYVVSHCNLHDSWLNSITI